MMDWHGHQVRRGLESLGLAFWGVIAALLVAFSTELIRKAILQFLSIDEFSGNSWSLLGFGCLLAVLTIIPSLKAFKRIRGLTHSRAAIYEIRHPKRKALVIGLSALRDTDGFWDGKAQTRPEKLAHAHARLYEISALSNDDEKHQARTKLLDDLCATETSAYVGLPWQQPFRILRELGGDVMVIGVLLSNRAEDQYEDFKTLAEGVLPDIRILGSSTPVDLEDYNDVVADLDDIVRRCLTETGGDEKDVCIDITGANKVYTAAATVKTLNNRALFSYASTDSDHIGEVRAYDAAIG